MLDAATAILSFTANQTLETFLANRMMRDAVAKNLEVLGEGAAILSEEVKGQTPHIPWPDIIGMRHRLVHHYGGTDWGVVWETVQQDLPPLIQHLEILLQKLQNQPPKSV